MNLRTLKALRLFHLINKKNYNEKRQIEIVKTSPLFDAKWYLEQNPDVKAKKIGAARHYVKWGWKEGRNPSKEFDTEAYLEQYPELLEKKWCPLFHYMLAHKELMQKANTKIKEKKTKTKKTTESTDYKLIAKSKYFDKRWYLKMYPDVKKAGVDPVKHYLQFGWKEGRNPSKGFKTEGYLRRYADVHINPLLHYEKYGKKEKRETGSYFDKNLIEEYWREHMKIKNVDKVIYTCISGNYDEIITDFVPNKEFDYVLFTDNKKLLKQNTFLFWQIKPLQFSELDSVRNARWHKMHPFKLFPKHQYTVWIDSNVQILGNATYEMLHNQIKDQHLMATAIHPYRNCLYQEAQECLLTHKDNAELVIKQIDIIRKDGFPEQYGLFETNIFFCQPHHKKVIKVLEKWWWFIENYSRRDQLSFNYVLWKTNMDCYPLDDKPLRFHPEFKLHQHNYKPSCRQATQILDKDFKILVHLHLYYHDQLDWFLAKLKNITCPYELFVTYVVENRESNTKLKKFKKDVHLIKVPNRGYDIAPFIHILNSVNLDNYRHILKLHTKNFRSSYWCYNGIKYIKYQWRNALVNALVGSKRIFRKNLYNLTNEFTGMIGNKNLISHRGAVANEDYRLAMCEKLGYNPKLDSYISGTMFICKSFLMKDIQRLNLSFDDFEQTVTTGITGTLAHAMESILGHTVENNGLKIKGRKIFEWHVFLNKMYNVWVNFKKRSKHSDDWYIQHSKYFDKKWYLKTYPDVKKSGIDPVEHYLKSGWKEGRNPGPKFNTNWYLNRYKDVKEAKVNPLVHYEKHGKYEGRSLKNTNIISSLNMLNKISKNTARGITHKKRQLKIIVSLTSYPARIEEVSYTIYSLLEQSLKPDEIVLWLGHDKFPNKEKDLPDMLLNLRKRGLSIKWCKDIRSYTKLIPTLKLYPDDIIVTADDDIYYPKDWLEKLYQSYQKHPAEIHCHRVHKITFDSQRHILPYKEWIQCYMTDYPTYTNFLTGVGGVLYPPHSLYKDVLKSSLFLKLAPYADDIWFWAMAVMKGTKIRNVKKGYSKLTYVNPEREYGIIEGATLAAENVVNGKNDEQLKKILKRYPELYKKLNAIAE